MSALKTALSLAAMMAGLSLVVAAPADAKPHCKTKVVKVVVRKVVCDCKPVAHKTKHVVKHASHKVHHTAWHEPSYPGRPEGVVYVDESTPPVYGGNRAINVDRFAASSAIYSRTVRITRGFAPGPGCGPCGGDLTGRIDDGMYDGGVGYGGDVWYGGGGYASPVVFSGYRLSASSAAQARYRYGRRRMGHD